MARDYAGIEFPIVVPEWKVSWGYSGFEASGLLAKLPGALQEKVNAAYNDSTDLTITQAECDSIDDQTWAELREKLGA